MKIILPVFLCIFFTATSVYAQSYAFGLKGGATLGFQRWDGFDQNALFKYHGIAFIESAPEDNSFAIFAQAGYHQKGSSEGGGTTTSIITGQPFRIPRREFVFHNISLTLGGKQKYNFRDGGSKYYYMFGLRGEYTVDTNLEQYETFNEATGSLYFPIPAFVREWNYGVTVGGGFEVPFSEFVAGFLEFSVSPDFSNQYQQPPIPNVRNPYTGQLTTLGSREIRNTTFEISLGIRFLHKIEYID